MALEDILKKIKKESEGEIKIIKEESQKEIEKIEKKYKEEIEKKKKKILELAEEKANKKIKHSQIKLSLETKNLILAKKQEILDGLYQGILEDLSKLKDEEYFKLILNLIKECPRNGEIIPAQNREKITEKAIREAKKECILSKNSLPIKGGFIFSSENLEIDNSFENLVKEIKEKTLMEVAKILFSST